MECFFLHISFTVKNRQITNLLQFKSEKSFQTLKISNISEIVNIVRTVCLSLTYRDYRQIVCISQ